MFEDDFPLINTPNLMILILRRAQLGNATVETCASHLAGLHEQTGLRLPLGAGQIAAKIATHISHLSVAGLIEQANHDGSWRLTGRGHEALLRHPKGFDLTDMMEYPEFAAFMRETAHRSAGMDARPRSYDEGYAARLDGLRMTENPYTINTVDHLSWENGWTQALEDQQSG